MTNKIVLKLLYSYLNVDGESEGNQTPEEMGKFVNLFIIPKLSIFL